jgi:hypothetical protein
LGKAVDVVVAVATSPFLSHDSHWRSSDFGDEAAATQGDYSHQLCQMLHPKY